MSESGERLSAERLLLFTDAVVAIAITLLVLPLVDLVPDVVKEHGEAQEVITGHLDEVASFLLSFAVIARLWSVHHKVFGTVAYHRRSVTTWNLAWLLTIVVLPFPTEMIGAFGDDRFVSSFYVLNILGSVLCQLAMMLILRAHPELLTDSGQSLQRSLVSTLATVCCLVLALALGLFVPSLQYYSLLLLLLTGPVERIARPRAPRAA